MNDTSAQTPYLAAIDEAIQKAGSQAKFAAAMGRSQPTIHAWRNKAGRAPADACPTIEALYGVRCEKLRPDLFWTRDNSGNVTGYHVPLEAA